eukprot:TRINITY_DN4995_c0_g1_i1.p1 TRINITY_DN4995_c0_g1~~TRINITY_DN4995_c0_g1_i1.p1  ORF type:complete len:279 (+),score=24.48 TRINITY_DN4995_c0_g1_i1:33-839(+)
MAEQPDPNNYSSGFGGYSDQPNSGGNPGYGDQINGDGQPPLSPYSSQPNLHSPGYRGSIDSFSSSFGNDSYPSINHSGSFANDRSEAIVNRDTVLSVLRDPDFKQEFGRVISAMIRVELEKALPSTNPQSYVQPPPTPVAAPPPPTTENLVKDVPTGVKSTIELKALVEREFPGSDLQLWKYYDQKGTIYGYPEEIEIDLIKHFDNNYLCDTRDSVDIGDVVTLIRIGKLYKTVNPTHSLACVVIAKTISEKAQKIATRANIRIINAQ